MAAIASSEFIALCQAQLQLLSAQVTASSSAVYITDYLAGSAEDAGASDADGTWVRRFRNEPNFVPIVSYPDSVESWIEQFERQQQPPELPQPLLPATQSADIQGADTQRANTKRADTQSADKRLDAPLSNRSTASRQQSFNQTNKYPADEYPGRQASDDSAIRSPDHQLVVPLVYSEVVVGLIVAIRRDRAWQNEERHYIEGVAQALAAGCVLERRSQWLQSQLTDKRDLQSRQSEIFHNLLHQFRNPLTAVSTFGQLLVRRLEPEDPNQKIATGIVRESKRLREMVSHFDETVAIGDADLRAEQAESATSTDEPLLLPPASVGLLPGSSPSGSSFPSTKGSTERSPDEAAPDALSALSSGAGLGHALTLSAQFLPDILEPILAVADIVAKEKEVQIYSQVAADTPVVWGEEEALGEVVSNLVDNAVKYSPAGACVFVQTGVSRTREGQHYQGVIVGDTGPGIPAVDLARLFERNYRGVQAEGDIPGTGLGLAIAQSLITQMQGTIEVISPAVGTPWLPKATLDQSTVSGPGTVFIVWLLEIDNYADGSATGAYSPTNARM
ncbi:MAG: GAF domain-containing sensor histidine kinase [Cyanobacteria bacterium J06621_11]